MTILQTYPICIVSNMIVVDFFMFEWMSQQLICVGDLDCFFSSRIDTWTVGSFKDPMFAINRCILYTPFHNL
jgi:hypothetical protein